MGIRCADHVTPLYPQKLALTSPTGGGRSDGIVRSRTKATEFFCYLLSNMRISNCEISVTHINMSYIVVPIKTRQLKTYAFDRFLSATL